MTPSRLPRFASILQGLAAASLILLPSLFVLGLFFPQIFWVDLPYFADLPPSGWPLTTWMGILVVMIPVVFALLALDAMRRLFGLYRAGDPLAPEAGPLIRAIGLYLLISALLGLALQPIHTGLLSLTNPPGERSISVGVSSSDVGFILVAGLLMLIGWSMSEATKAVAENKEFI